MGSVARWGGRLWLGGRPRGACTGSGLRPFSAAHAIPHTAAGADKHGSDNRNRILLTLLGCLCSHTAEQHGGGKREPAAAETCSTSLAPPIILQRSTATTTGTSPPPSSASSSWKRWRRWGWLVGGSGGGEVGGWVGWLFLSLPTSAMACRVRAEKTCIMWGQGIKPPVPPGGWRAASHPRRGAACMVDCWLMRLPAPCAHGGVATAGRDENSRHTYSCCFLGQVEQGMH